MGKYEFLYWRKRKIQEAGEVDQDSSIKAEYRGLLIHDQWTYQKAGITLTRVLTIPPDIPHVRGFQPQKGRIHMPENHYHEHNRLGRHVSSRCSVGGSPSS